MQPEISGVLQKVIQQVFDVTIDVVLTRPDEQFGDYSTNVAMQLAGKLGKNPREIAEAIVDRLGHKSIAKAEVAGAGFINLALSDEALADLMHAEPTKSLEGKVVVAEYSDPNPFKVLHAGHLYTSIIGDAIASLLENAGAETHRVNFGGDVGLHVGKTMWAMLVELGGANPEKLKDISAENRSEWLAQCYIKGTNAYEESGTAGNDPQIKLDIILINRQIYSVWSGESEQDNLFKSIIPGEVLSVSFEKLKEIYLTARQWSYDYFDAFYERIGSKFEKYYPESVVAELGLKTVKEQLAKGVFAESDGAVIFKGEDHGLHTRVFINSEGIPTYEAKDIGLIMTKWADYHFDKSIVITGNEQEQYMQVVLKAVEQFAPELSRATSHLTHGIVKLAGGVKMSSRKGNILRAVDVLDAASEANKAATDKDDQNVVLGAVKYAFLKQRTGGDIIYDPKESVSLEGNSGPYLQYAHARACSILRKSEEFFGRIPAHALSNFEVGERTLVRKLGMYAEVVEQATTELMPHHICTYLYELAQTFNRFYENNKVIGDPREDIRLHLVSTYADTLKNGLSLLGIHAPEQM